MFKLSIITVNLNNATGLRKTIESVRAQVFRNFEHIIIDGGSTDNSIEVIKKYEDGFSYWVSEPDGGIYQGMNKGTRVAKGEYCLYLNSGDYLYNSKVLEKVFRERFCEDLVYGDAVVKNIAGKNIKGFENNINLPGFYLNHQNIFIKNSLLKKMNGYDESYKICSDRHFFMNAIFILGASHRYIRTKISVYNLNGISGNKQNFKLKRIEVSRIEKEIIPNPQIRLEMAILDFLMKDFRIDIKSKLKDISPVLKKQVKNRNVYIWGIGQYAAKVLNLLEKNKIRIEAFIDSNKEYQGLNFAGYKIYAPEQILINKNIYVIIASSIYCKEMVKICDTYGLKEKNDFFIPFDKKKLTS